MAIEELDKAQEKLEPKDDLAPYAGQWVAVRDGKVIASDIDPVRLRDRSEVNQDDVILPVAHSRPGIFIA